MCKEFTQPHRVYFISRSAEQTIQPLIRDNYEKSNPRRNGKWSLLLQTSSP